MVNVAQKDRDKVLFIGAGCQWIRVHTTSGYRYCSNKVLLDDSGSFLLEMLSISQLVV